MPSPPAHCDSCGAFFPAPIQLDNSRNISFSGVAVTCPRCGGVGRIPDGTYDFVGNAIHLLSGPAHSADTLRRLSALLTAAKERGDDRAQVAEALAAEAANFKSLTDLLPTNRGELYAFVALIIALIALLLQPQGGSQVTVEQVYNTVVLPTSPTSKPATPGRNDECYCGSGKKYKNCHLGKE